MRYSAVSLAGIKAELSCLAEENLLAEPLGKLHNIDNQERVVAHVLALLAQFARAIRCGSFPSATSARRQLLNILAVVVGLGLDFVGVIMRALAEVSLMLTLYFDETVNLASILGVELDSLEQVNDPNTLLFLTYDELKQIHSGQKGPVKSEAKDHFIVDAILMQSKLRITNDAGVKKLANALYKTKPPSRVNFVQQDNEQAGIMNLPYFLDKKRTLH